MVTGKDAEVGYIVVSCRRIRKGTVIRQKNGRVLFRFSEGGGVMLPAERIYRDEKDAQAAVNAYQQLHPPKKPSQRIGMHIGNAWLPL